MYSGETVHISSLALLKVPTPSICSGGRLMIDAQTRSSGSTYGGHGFDVGRVRRWLHSQCTRNLSWRKLMPDLMCRRLCYASIWNYRHSRVGRSRLPDENAGYVETDRKVWDHLGPGIEGWIADDRPEMVVGWYHSHPGFGCWLSSVDVNTQQVDRVYSCEIRSWPPVIRATSPKSSRSGCRPHSIRTRKSRHWRFPIYQHTITHCRTRIKADDK